ncbi:TIGR03915 family putative DNA repair protein [Spirosoma sp. RP8]|uniref:TIGR03915 family putative DNA repair protein n=1 Tax=Spirosoma liriopis TaxID=2937440 RepID=A0ABT0HTB7_9BACT|nr:TIGR03915 family putative DNA repair protein [Spirosoma liriopis]MCK8495420.1 TIGR03915 family putative DNA repair protein [Spirosoma liriopis]
MTSIVYDGTYEGWLTAIFAIYDHKLTDVAFSRSEASTGSLFGRTHSVTTDEVKAERVLIGLRKRLSEEGMTRLYKTFLSDLDRPDDVMWSFVSHVFASAQNVEEDYAHPAVWAVKQAAKRVQREAHRMEAFVRFKLTSDQLYYALIEPDCDVLGLICPHFESRYADQRWLIYDAKRRYGIYYDLEKATTVTLGVQDGRTNRSGLVAEISDEGEAFYQELWRRYFKSVTIDARKNKRLQLQHMPKRYWKYLTEKMP